MSMLTGIFRCWRRRSLDSLLSSGGAAITVRQTGDVRGMLETTASALVVCGISVLVHFDAMQCHRHRRCWIPHQWYWGPRVE
jgi:hypothetical protein